MVWTGGTVYRNGLPFRVNNSIKTGNILLSQTPAYTGFRGGLNRVNSDEGLTKLFSWNADSITADVMKTCNSYRNRKSSNLNGSSSDSLNNSRLVIRKLADNSYRIGLTKLNEFIDFPLDPLNVNTSNLIFSDLVAPFTNMNLKFSFLQGATTLKTLALELGATIGGQSITINPVSLGLAKLNEITTPICTTTASSSICKTVYKTATTSEELITTETPNLLSLKSSNSGTTTSSTDYTAQTVEAIIGGDYSKKVFATCTPSGGMNFKCPYVESIYNMNKIEVKKNLVNPTLVFKFKKHSSNARSFVDMDYEFNEGDSAYYSYPKWDNTDLVISPKNFLTLKNGNDASGKGGPNAITSEKTLHFKKPFIIDPDYDLAVYKTFKNTNVTLNAEEAASLETTAQSYFTKCNDFGSSTSEDANSAYDADWNKNAFFAWNYNPIDSEDMYKPGNTAEKKLEFENIFDLTKPNNLNTIIINSAGLFKDKTFHSYGVVDRCIVESSATNVTGFLVCRYMVIKARTTPLTMTGTFIVDKLEIETPLKANIYWRNIYHPASRAILETAEIARNWLIPTKYCTIDGNFPNWFYNRQTYGKIKSCDVNVLINKAQPTSWTSFSPLCTLLQPTDLYTTCKPEKRAYNFNVVILNEEYTH